MSTFSLKMSKMSHTNLKMSKHNIIECQNFQNFNQKCQKFSPKNPKMSNIKSPFRSTHFKMAFSHSVYLGLSFQLVSSELVISVSQNVITSEYQNFCCVKILDCCVGILDQKFLCKQFFAFNILLQTIFCSLFSLQAIF